MKTIIQNAIKLTGLLKKNQFENRIVFTLIFFISIVNPEIATAQTATITGEIRDADTGETLPGANVVIEGTSMGGATDVDGRFTIRRVPAGTHTILIRYMGYITQEEIISLSSGERLVMNINLANDMIEGDEVFVIATQRGQARALTRQRESVNIRSVISSEQIDRFGSSTVSSALGRIAGMGHGGSNIRGLGSGSSNVTMDGQRMGTTGSGRSVDLGTISADMVQELEVIKVITPDMDADALSGVINISTRRPVGGEREMNARLRGGWNSRFGGMMGPSSRASFSYGDSPRDNFSYAVNLSHQRSPSASESIRTDWEIATFDDYGAVTVLDDMRSEFNTSLQDRYGTALQFTFQPTDRTTFHIQSMFNFQDRERMYYEIRHRPTEDRYITPDMTGGPGNQGRFDYDSELRYNRTHQYTFQSGGRHLFDGFDMEYAMGWGHGRSHQDRYQLPFRTTARYEFIVDLQDRWHPTLEIAPHSERIEYPGAGDFIFQGVDQRWDYHVDNEFTGALDFEVPITYGSIKFGGSALLTYKNGNQERYDKEYDRRLNLSDFQTVLNADWRIFDRTHQTYHIPWVIDLPSARNWYYGEYPNFDFDFDNWAEATETEYFSANENTYATYGMGIIDIGSVRLLGGIRMEHTATRYDGRDGTISDQGRFRGAVDTSAVNNYTHFFPNAQIVYGLTQMTNVRLAYSRSIGRPNFSQLSPYVLRDHNSEDLSHGNPHLKPMLTNNLDLLFEHYFMDVGQFTVGLYYKEMRDFVYSYSEIIHPDGTDGEGLYAGWRRRTYLNGEEAMAYGLEVSWQQNLNFLPGFLSYLGIYSNYGYAYSEAEVTGRRGSDYGEDDPPRLQGQRPHVFNLALDYSRGAFFGQVSYRWTAPYVSSYGDRRRVPEIDPDIRVWFDRYSDASRSGPSFSFRYRLTDNFRLEASASPFNFRSASYYYSREFYPRDMDIGGGRSFSLGVRYTF